MPAKIFWEEEEQWSNVISRATARLIASVICDDEAGLRLRLTLEHTRLRRSAFKFL